MITAPHATDEQEPVAVAVASKVITLLNKHLQPVDVANAPVLFGIEQVCVMTPTKLYVAEKSSQHHLYDLADKSWTTLQPIVNLKFLNTQHKLIVQRLSTRVVAITTGKCTHLFDVLQNKLIGEIFDKHITIQPIDDDKFVVYYQRTKEVSVRNIPNNTELYRYSFDYSYSMATNVTLHAQGSYIGICAAEEILFVFNYETGDIIIEVENAIEAYMGDNFLTVLRLSEVFLFDTSNYELVQRKIVGSNILLYNDVYCLENSYLTSLEHGRKAEIVNMRQSHHEKLPNGSINFYGYNYSLMFDWNKGTSECKSYGNRVYSLARGNSKQINTCLSVA
jgi:hypothetical protein